MNLMATSHARSISLPSRSHPTVSQIQELLVRLSPAETATLSAIKCKLSGLGDVFDFFDKFLLLQQTKEALSRDHCNEKLADELLDGLVLLLDVCGTAEDVLSEAKEHIQELQSTLRRRRRRRRRRSDEFELAKEVSEYTASRKKAKKVIHKVLKDLKTKSNFCSPSSSDTIVIVEMSRRIQGVALATLQSLLFYISGLKTQSRLSGWRSVSDLIMRSTKHVACVDTVTERNEFEKVDAELDMLLGHKAKKSCNLRIENVQTDLGKLVTSIEDLEQEIECLHRGLIKARVSLLNILNH